jgi:signal transduction histidine kinase/CheY-like chemotaxis protein
MTHSDEQQRIWNSLNDCLDNRDATAGVRTIQASWTGVPQELNHTLAELSVIGASIAANLSSESVFESFHQVAGRMLNMQHLAIYRLVTNRRELQQVFVREAGKPLPCVDPISMDDRHSFCAQVVRTRQEIVVDSANEASAAAHIPGTLWMASLMFFPLAAGDKLLGVISIQSTEPNAFGPREKFICRTLAAYGAIALENAEAYRRLDEATVELNRMNRSLLMQRDELDRASRAKTQLFAAASHDLRQPMQSLLLLTESLEQRINSGARADDVTRSIRSAIQAMLDMFDGLMDISKFDAGVVKPQIADVEIATYLERIRTEFSHQTDMRRVRLNVRSSSVIVRTDPILLYRILSNLVSNAVRYTTKGRILVGCRRKDKTVRVEVWDTGPGIPADKLDEIFYEFVRLTGNRHGEEAVYDPPCRWEGCGLGLAIVQRAAKLMNLPISVSSRPGKGSVFAVELPYGEAHRVVPAGAAEIDAVTRQLIGRHVLIVDDEQAILDAMTHLLQSWGCAVTRACSVAEAQTAVRQSGRKLDAVISDFRLSGRETGLDAIAALHGEFGHTPAILISGDTAQQVRDAVEGAGHRLLCKPVAPARLRSLLNNLMKEA